MTRDDWHQLGWWLWYAECWTVLLALPAAILLQEHPKVTALRLTLWGVTIGVHVLATCLMLRTEKR